VLTSFTHVYLHQPYTQKERRENAVALAAANKAAEKKEKDAAKKARKEKAKAEAVSICGNLPGFTFYFIISSHMTCCTTKGAKKKG